MSLTTVLIGAIPTILGIISTYFAWRYNPRNRIMEELDSIARQLKGLYEIQDIALEKNQNDIVTITHHNIMELRQREESLLRRLTGT